MKKAGIYQDKVKNLFYKFDREVSGENALRITLLMTLFILIMFMQHNQFLRGILFLLIPVGFLIHKVTFSKLYWAAIALFVTIGFIPLYHWADNHYFLTVYWTIAVALSMWSLNPKMNISFNAKILIGLCFTFATFWKFMSPEFLEGSFFKFTMLTDWRFQELAEIAAGVTPEMRSYNNELYRQIISSTERMGSVTLSGTDFLKPFSIFIAYWTVFIEGWIAIAFLVPGKSIIGKWRDIPLLLFMISTYPIATVRGFAALLAVMGFAQCTKENRQMRFVYLIIFLGVPLFSLPFERITIEIMNFFS